MAQVSHTRTQKHGITKWEIFARNFSWKSISCKKWCYGLLNFFNGLDFILLLKLNDIISSQNLTFCVYIWLRWKIKGRSIGDLFFVTRPLSLIFSLGVMTKDNSSFFSIMVTYFCSPNNRRIYPMGELKIFATITKFW